MQNKNLENSATLHLWLLRSKSFVHSQKNSVPKFKHSFSPYFYKFLNARSYLETRLFNFS
jgi:hypothetical protein